MAKHIKMRFEFKDDAEWVKVFDLYPERHRYLEFEDTIQGIMSLDMPDVPVLEYVGLMAALTRSLCPRPETTLLAGLGSCALFHAVRSFWPKTAWHRCVEESSRVIDLATRFFRLPPEANMIEGDLREALEGDRLSGMDCILVDCFGPRNMPPHLMTLEFVFLVHRALARNGVALFNVWKSDCNPVFWNQMRTFLEVFGGLGLVSCRVDSNVVVCLHKADKPFFPEHQAYAGRDYPVRAILRQRKITWPRELLEAEKIEDATLYEFIKIIHERGPS